MNIIFNSLEINDFQSIGHANIDLDNLGICVVKGINNYEDNTSSNGSGKSSIFEALYFSLYGKTTTGLTNVSNRYTGNTYKLKLKLSIDNVEYEIIREGTKIKLLQNGEDISRRNKTDTENYIKENILKISPEIFLNIMYLAQGFKNRLSALTAGGRKDQIEEIIGTNEITESFRIEVQNYKEKLNNELNETNNKISFNDGTINQIKNNIESYQEEINKINEENKNKPSKESLIEQLNNFKSLQDQEEKTLLNLNNEINKIKEYNNDKNLELAKIETIIKEKENETTKQIYELNTNVYNVSMEIEKEFNDKASELKQKISEIEHANSLLLMQNTNLNIKVNENKNQIETLKTSDTCPTCGRKFDNFDQTHLIQEIQKFIDNNIENNKQINENNLKIEENSKIINELNEEYNKVTDKQIILDKKSEASKPYHDEIQKLNQEYAKYLAEKTSEKNKITKELRDTTQYDTQINQINNNISNYKVNISNLENEINNLEIKSTDNYEKMIQDCNEKLVILVKENESLQKQSENLTEQIGVATHSISLITKEFKNYLLKSAIDFLNIRLDYYSSLLFSNETDKIRFFQDGNKLDIYLGDALFESLSGGEKRKVDIVIMLAQKDLANNMSSTYSNILICDEIFDGLDSKSIDVVTSILMSVSKDISSMFIVSHKDTSIGADKQLLVIKGKDRISYVQ